MRILDVLWTNLLWRCGKSMHTLTLLPLLWTSSRFFPPKICSRACFHFGGAFCPTGAGRAPRSLCDKKLLWAREPGCFAYFNFSIHVWYLNTRVWYTYCNHDFFALESQGSITQIHQKSCLATFN